MNIFYARNVIDGWATEGLDGMLDALSAWWNTNVKPLQDGAWTLSRIVGTNLDEEFGQQRILAVDTIGTLAGDGAPSLLAVYVEFVGDAGAEPPRGGIYHMGLVDEVVDTSYITSTYAGQLEDAYTALGAAISGEDINAAQVIVSRYQGRSLVLQPNGETIFEPTKRATALTNTLDDVRVKRRIATQRRRRTPTQVTVT